MESVGSYIDLVSLVGEDLGSIRLLTKVAGGYPIGKTSTFPNVYDKPFPVSSKIPESMLTRYFLLKDFCAP